ncbi:hypothetical protein [Streptomyces microflavus]|uniref:hypothetical protein n=1 Tax=Streptomyces microflavus TaxID=1919 RepID=UPI003321BA8C
MRKHPNNRTTLLFRNKPALALGVMALGTTMLALGLPAEWIDLAALALATMTVSPAAPVTARTSPRKNRRKNRTTKRRTPRDTR